MNFMWCNVFNGKKLYYHCYFTIGWQSVCHSHRYLIRYQTHVHTIFNTKPFPSTRITCSIYSFVGLSGQCYPGLNNKLHNVTFLTTLVYQCDKHKVHKWQRVNFPREQFLKHYDLWTWYTGCGISSTTDLHNEKKNTETRKNVCIEYV